MDEMDNRWMETEEEEEESEEEESEGEGEEEEEEDIMEEEEAEQLEEMRSPVATSWMGTDGITVHGIMVIDDGIFRLKNRCQFDDCSICYKPPSATQGRHQICCLPCGHMYGFSCIKKWLLQSSSSGKCPQCNTLCSFEDAILLYPPPLCVAAHQKASSAAFFPFTEQGFLEFKKYEYSRRHDAMLLHADDVRHVNIFVTQHCDLVDREKKWARKLVDLLKRVQELLERNESLGLANALYTRASLLKPRVKALGPLVDKLDRLIIALKRRIDALEQRYNAFESRMTFYLQMYKKHHKTKKNNNEPCTTCSHKH